MKYHHPSFLWELKRRFDETFDVYDHHLTIYIVTENKYFSQEILRGLIVEAITDALIAPHDTPDGPRQRSLFDTPPEPHLDALKAALLARCDYLEKREILTAGGERFEWRVNCKRMQEIIADVRTAQDVNLALGVMQGDLFISNRLLYKKILRYQGRAFSDRRLRDLMEQLEIEGYVKGNGHLRSYGRDVLCKRQ
jgi:hypothetical protein